MKKILLGVGITVILALTGVYTYAVVKDTTEQPKALQTAPTTVAEPPTPPELLKYTNIKRKKAGVAPLRLDSKLNSSAQLKADDMASYDYYEHVNPKTGKKGAQYIVEKDMGCKKVSENLTGWNSGEDALDVIDYLSTSKAHYMAMVDPSYDLVGFAVVEDMVVQHFCDLP